MESLPPTVRAAVEAKLKPDEEVLWSGRPIARHAWTMIGTTYPRGRLGRALSLVMFEACAATILSIGLLLAATFVAMLIEFEWKIPQAIGLILLAPVSVVVSGGGFQIAMTPKRIYDWAQTARYILTTHHAFTVSFDGETVEVKELDLSRAMAPDVYRLASNGVGDVVFDAHVTELVGGDSDTSTAWSDRGFFAVPNARDVAERVAEARAERIRRVYGEDAL